MTRLFLNFVLSTRKPNSLIDQLLSKEIQSFIEEHQEDDPNDLRLKYKTIFDIPASARDRSNFRKKKSQGKTPDLV